MVAVLLTCVVMICNITYLLYGHQPLPYISISLHIMGKKWLSVVSIFNQEHLGCSDGWLIKTRQSSVNFDENLHYKGDFTSKLAVMSRPCYDRVYYLAQSCNDYFFSMATTCYTI